ncbi:DUF3576 domain-containing protein [Pseudorhodobacter sp. E13]|uniref:DUF3576 domain-containing protein n=1 Tax=Pseudorhodobacter sp. E13 TaxID=2487931 RepID=UPI000F8EF0FD|nr:DUF3576 domain-containing protein [Pseudorhodobacter sp. E13]RUS59662.1 DUF3576 domain-containing protein [Pseudorhodobacter sp. E13]
MSRYLLRATVMGVTVALVASCSGIASGDSGLFGSRNRNTVPSEATLRSKQAADAQRAALEASKPREDNGTLWDLFTNSDDPNTTVEVNKYIWNATLDILNFLPVQTVDPFTGVIVTGYGTPPGGGRAYRATVYIQDPALDARSLKLSLQTRGGGAVSRDTQRAVEDAILTRARQLRIRDSKL